METVRSEDELKSMAPLQLISEVKEFKNIHEFLQDDDFDKALVDVIKLIGRAGNVNSAQAAVLIVRLSALGTKFGIQGANYKYLAKGTIATEEGKKRSLYLAMHEYLKHLVDALKYISKQGNSFG